MPAQSGPANGSRHGGRATWALSHLGVRTRPGAWMGPAPAQVPLPAFSRDLGLPVAFHGSHGGKGGERVSGRAGV